MKAPKKTLELAYAARVAAAVELRLGRNNSGNLHDR
jgi:hypothetical protein